MNPPSIRQFALGMAALCIFLAQLAHAAECSAPIRLGTGQQEPYGYYDKQKRFVGLDADMVRAILKEAGCTLIELPKMPASRNLLLFEKGKLDLLFGSSITPERLHMAHFSIAYRDETVGLYALAAKFDEVAAGIDSFADFLSGPGALLGPRAGWYGADYERQVPALKRGGRLSLYGDVDEGVRMLAAGRAPLMLADAGMMDNAAARLGVKVRALPFWVVQAPVHLMFSKATVSPEDVRRIDAAIARLQQRGTFEQIRQSYGAI
jgi:polar amino acid transport system substrate-binding protein